MQEADSGCSFADTEIRVDSWRRGHLSTHLGKVREGAWAHLGKSIPGRGLQGGRNSQASGWSRARDQVGEREWRAERGQWGQILLGLMVTMRTWALLWVAPGRRQAGSDLVSVHGAGHRLQGQGCLGSDRLVVVEVLISRQILGLF